MPNRRATSVVGTSIAAIETYIRLPEYGLAFDMGCCPTNSIDIGHVFLTHGHVDHCGAVAAHASLRALNDLPAAEYIAPTVMVPVLERVFSPMTSSAASSCRGDYGRSKSATKSPSARISSSVRSRPTIG
jgi:ribonuclease BN (tRNA processing enzyme)